MDNLQLTRVPVMKTGMLIRKPAADVFEAFVNPDITTKIWDPATGKEIHTLTGHTQEITTVAVSPDGQSVLTGSRDGTAIVWLTAPVSFSAPAPGWTGLGGGAAEMAAPHLPQNFASSGFD